MLAVLFACKRFHQYICGRKNITIETDHSPLINIFKKQLLKTPKRLQQMILELQKYNFTIKYKKGAEIYVADTLSRAPEDCHSQSCVEIYKIDKEFRQLNNINDIEDKPISTKDNVMQILIKTIKDGWTEDKSKVNDNIKQYWKVRDELITNNNLLFKGNRLVVPPQMRREILNKPHQGMESTLKLARETVYWIGITDEIKQMIQACEICNVDARLQQREPLIIPVIPRTPFEIISMDVFEFPTKNKTKYFLITVDHYSDFFEIDELDNLSATLSRHGVPGKVITDNGTNFMNSEFRKFADKWEFNHQTSSPHHQQANGKAEAAVKIAKHLLKKTLATNSDFYKALLIWRNTPNNIGSSPAKRLFCRWLRCDIPATNLNQEVVPDVPNQIKQQRTYNKKYFDKGTQKEKDLKIGDETKHYSHNETKHQETEVARITDSPSNGKRPPYRTTSSKTSGTTASSPGTK
ncbi:uncharacterized protein K02A2.6-like [Rhagoletis pomonella]|uniref:uncharacterized protein K02A2.6-like n=1 Tax=Rhagoletis pomonella TaxID=28610 RepID=UPI001782607F|nr:uncharacterized protein K02A2.6-like [Rhagoletis pomonella]